MSWEELDLIQVLRIVVDIALVWFVIYKLFSVIRGTKAVQLLKGIFVVLGIWFFSSILELKTVQWLVYQAITWGFLAVIILFQPEIRRALEQLGRGSFFARNTQSEEKAIHETIDAIVKSCNYMSKRRIGALITIERETGMSEYVETGVDVHGKLTSELLTNIFIPNAPLHDGAVIIKADEIVAAACYLPLSESPFISKELGTRHRAAMGVSEVTDALTLIVSEETGNISATKNGELHRKLDEEDLRKLLMKELNPAEGTSASKSWSWRGSEMDNWIKSPWFTRIVSLFLAILLYTTVAIDEANTSRSNDIFLPTGSSDVETMENVPLQVDLEEDDYVVRGVPDTVNVTVEGPRSVITQTVRQRNFDVFIDLNDLGPGQHEVDVLHAGISSQLSVYIEPRTVDITIEERSTVSFPVEVDFFGHDELGETDAFASEPVVAPEEVDITGSSAEVDRIAMVKAIVSLTDLAEDGVINDAPIRVYDAQGNELSVYVDPSTVSVEADVSINDKRYPLTYELSGELDDSLVLQGVNLNPVSATLYGSLERLDEINMLEPLEIDLSEIEETTILEVDVPVPSGVTRAEPETAEVEVAVEEAIEDTLDDVEIEVDNLEDNQEITFIDPEEALIDVNVIGTQDDLDDLSSDNIRVWIDVDGQVEGEFYADLQLDGPEGIRLSTEEERVRVRIE
ncbi:hypothetical protein AHA02nite_21830 [Alkalibacillus haloalkaliphilus]|uniref:Diadenylate cyclase n=2 Tax=Alkalibacillus haloalkaliphilus TaxID=94136 RepID=A0A511W604_9BACI|nr:hypothetical protein AHA02nite_21830 [Alkalibacillus haloalkaliphilus]